MTPQNAREYVRSIELPCNLPDCDAQAGEIVDRGGETIAVCERHERLFPVVEL